MRLLRMGFLFLVLAGVGLVAGCGGGAHKQEHPAPQAGVSAPAPTPDTTPVEALRTPAGLVLKAGPESGQTPPSTVPTVPPSAKENP
jgi:hypothetical protein